MKKKSHKFNPPKWSKLNKGKIKPVEPQAGSWTMFYFKQNRLGQFTDLRGNLVCFKIKKPNHIDFEGKQLDIVKKTLKNLTHEQSEIAKYFGFGPPTKQWTPVIDRLIDTYDVNPPHAARILAVTQAAINDAMIITWRIKYLTDISRPDQVDPQLKTVIPTPHFPGFPSGHATMSGCAEVILSYFFPGESLRLKEIAEEGAKSRLYAGIHFPIDNDEGLRLGRQIGTHIVKILKKQKDAKLMQVDNPYKETKHAVLPPPPYKQVIPFPSK